MQVKTFSGPNAQFVLAQVKADLGTDAVILSSRDIVRDGQKWHEVTASVDRPSDGSTMPQAWDDWHKEWDRVKEHLYALMKPSMQWEKLSPRQRVALEYLQREGVDDPVIMDIYQSMVATPGASVLEVLSERVPSRPWSLEAWPERIHVMAGPSGSGKTTAALRMALLLRQENPGLRIAFINADCERANGRLLLRHWAELSNLSYLEASDAESMRSAVRACSEMDLVFIDLPGLGGKENPDLLGQLGMLGIQIGAAVHLVLPPHYGSAQNRLLLNRYAPALLSSIVWTKLDEAAHFGPLINVAVASGLPVSALSYGSAMRETLSPAEETFLWRLVFKRQLPSRLPVSDAAGGADVTTTSVMTGSMDADAADAVQA